MKRYRLLKDIPEAKAGTVFESSAYSMYEYKTNLNEMAYVYSKYVHGNKDFFEEIKEEEQFKIKLFQCHHINGQEESSYSFKTNKQIPETSYHEVCDAIVSSVNKNKASQPIGVKEEEPIEVQRLNGTRVVGQRNLWFYVFYVNKEITEDKLDRVKDAIEFALLNMEHLVPARKWSDNNMIEFGRFCIPNSCSNQNKDELANSLFKNWKQLVKT